MKKNEDAEDTEESYVKNGEHRPSFAFFRSTQSLVLFFGEKGKIIAARLLPLQVSWVDPRSFWKGYRHMVLCNYWLRGGVKGLTLAFWTAAIYKFLGFSSSFLDSAP